MIIRRGWLWSARPWMCCMCSILHSVGPMTTSSAPSRSKRERLSARSKRGRVRSRRFEQASSSSRRAFSPLRQAGAAPAHDGRRDRLNRALDDSKPLRFFWEALAFMVGFVLSLLVT